MTVLRFLAATLLAATMPAAPAPAQTRKPTVPETRLIRDCVDRKGAGQKCIGLVAARCMKKPENQAGLNRADCYRIEQEIWEALLNQNDKELQGELDEEQQVKLQDMQRAWIASRDATCEFYDHKIQGSMSVPMTGACLLNETARRALLLAAFGGL
jgi:uncharacterized protein YecT (DUF1311 family)